MSANFDDGKEDGALRTIGEVSKALDIKTHVLRYWEQQFPMLEPLKRSGGRRYYRPEDVELIETIDRLVNGEGYTLKGAQQAIESGKTDDAGQDEPADVEDTPVSSAADTVPLELTTPIAESGGVGEFFGTSPTVSSESSEPILELSEVEEASMSRAEILARLKNIRGRLADSLAA